METNRSVQTHIKAIKKHFLSDEKNLSVLKEVTNELHKIFQIGAKQVAPTRLSNMFNFIEHIGACLAQKNLFSTGNWGFEERKFLISMICFIKKFYLEKLRDLEAWLSLLAAISSVPSSNLLKQCAEEAIGTCSFKQAILKNVMIGMKHLKDLIRRLDRPDHIVKIYLKAYATWSQQAFPIDTALEVDPNLDALFTYFTHLSTTLEIVQKDPSLLDYHHAALLQKHYLKLFYFFYSLCNMQSDSPQALMEDLRVAQLNFSDKQAEHIYQQKHIGRYALSDVEGHVLLEMWYKQKALQLFYTEWLKVGPYLENITSLKVLRELSQKFQIIAKTACQRELIYAPIFIPG